MKEFKYTITDPEGIMGLAVKNGQEVTLTFEGEDEEAAYEAVSQFMKENM